MTHTLINRLKKIRARTLKLCEPITPETAVMQPIVDVSPPKWHLAHTTWFFETFLLKSYFKSFKVFDPTFDYLFNSYYESMGPRLARQNRGQIFKPTLDEVIKYRAYIDEILFSWLSPELPAPIWKLIEIGIHHEEQHQELLLTDIKYILAHHPSQPAYLQGTSQNSSKKTKRDFQIIKEGLYDVGHSGDGFAFDNERGRHRVYLHDFKIATSLVTNGEYLSFIQDNGYQRPDFWHADGWDLISHNNIRAPLYWHTTNNQWWLYTLNGLTPLDNEIEAPVCHVNFYEASAYAQWKKQRLPTEFEWEIACKQLAMPDNNTNLQEKGIFKPLTQQENNNQFFGDVWEWTGSAYLPYPGFQKESGSIGEYNGKFMVNQMVLRGGSCATPQEHIRSTYRNFFQPDKRWQFSGIRLADSL